jgi:hypothetical protein
VSRVPPHLRRVPCTALLLACALAGCGAPPPDLTATPAVPAPTGTATTLPATAGTPSGTAAPPTLLPPLTPRPAIPTASPTAATGFPEDYAVDCGGRPSGTQVIRLLRREGVVPGGVRTTVDTGPLCAGTWHYTVVTVPGREPLAVVSRGRPSSLRLVTAGTNVCSIPVRTEAPTGIRIAAACL